MTRLGKVGVAVGTPWGKYSGLLQKRRRVEICLSFQQFQGLNAVVAIGYLRPPASGCLNLSDRSPRCLSELVKASPPIFVPKI
jgi:hypothetical protein